MRLVRD